MTIKHSPEWEKYWDEKYLFKQWEKYWRDNMPRHDNPEDYGLTTNEVRLMRLRYKKGLLEQAEESLSRVLSYLGEKDPQCLLWIKEMIIDYSKKRDNLKKSVAFLQDKSKDHKLFDLEQIKRIPISQIISTPVLKQSTNIDWYLCLFHKDTSPSMAVYKETNSFHCFACGESGSVVDIFMKQEGLDFGKSCKHLSYFV